jgi:hypothetical protein
MGEKSNEIGEGTAGTAQAPAATGGRVTETPLAPGVGSELTGADPAPGGGRIVGDPSGLQNRLGEMQEDDSQSTGDPQPPH